MKILTRPDGNFFFALERLTDRAVPPDREITLPAGRTGPDVCPDHPDRTARGRIGGTESTPRLRAHSRLSVRRMLNNMSIVTFLPVKLQTGYEPLFRLRLSWGLYPLRYGAPTLG
jgi:hypothetical protein